MPPRKPDPGGLLRLMADCRGRTRRRPGWSATPRRTSAVARAAGVRGRGRHLGLPPGGAARRPRRTACSDRPADLVSLRSALRDRRPRPCATLFRRILRRSMTHLLIWGETREIFAGEVPAGSPAEEVRSLAALQAALDGRGAALVLADPRCLDGRARRGRGLAARGRLGAGRAGGGGGPGRGRRGAAPPPLRGRPAAAAGDPGAAAPQARAGHRGRPRPAPRHPAAREGLQPQGRGAQPAQPDRGGALRRARHQAPARADPEQEPRDHRRGRGEPLPRRARAGRAQARTATGCASSSPRTTACPWRTSRSSRCPSTRPRSRATWRSPGRR